jgi:hypothetical protein
MMKILRTIMRPTLGKCTVENCGEPAEAGTAWCERHRGGRVNWTLPRDKKPKHKHRWEKPPG